jgi:hypothetical protein
LLFPRGSNRNRSKSDEKIESCGDVGRRPSLPPEIQPGRPAAAAADRVVNESEIPSYSLSVSLNFSTSKKKKKNENKNLLRCFAVVVSSGREIAVGKTAKLSTCTTTTKPSPNRFLFSSSLLLREREKKCLYNVISLTYVTNRPTVM